MGPIVLTGTLVRRLLPGLHLQIAQRQFIAPVHASTVRNGQVTINLAPTSGATRSKNKKIGPEYGHHPVQPGWLAQN